MTKSWLSLKFFQTSLLFWKHFIVVSYLGSVAKYTKHVSKDFSQEKPIYGHFWWKMTILKTPYQPKIPWNKTIANSLGKLWSEVLLFRGVFILNLIQKVFLLMLPKSGRDKSQPLTPIPLRKKTKLFLTVELKISGCKRWCPKDLLVSLCGNVLFCQKLTIWRILS